LNHHNQNDYVSERCSEDTGFTSKDFGVWHDSILAQGAVNV
jgi:hypothetical protein